MRDRPSATAAWVAACRTLGSKLPKEARLADDPYGASFAGRGVELFARSAPRLTTLPFWPFALYMQVRTRAIDDVLRAFAMERGAADGGSQVLILGAGYDCRAARFADELRGARVFEVDHPATQLRKREVLARASALSAPVTYLPWDFESRPTSELPAALGEVGHDASKPTLTIWEGVTMYLSEAAIETTVAAVGALSARGSRFVVTYFDRERIARPGAGSAIVAKLVAGRGEPFRFGWAPAEVPSWFAARGFAVKWDRTMADLARTLLPPAHARAVGERQSRIVVLEKDYCTITSDRTTKS
jgi:methyltransferase (TIGR00027 family)